MSKANILLVDDTPENLQALEAVLDTIDANIVTASSGEEALRKLLEKDFAVMLLDVRMPQMDGFELASLMRQREKSKHTPIIFVSALGSDENFIRQGYSHGAVDYLLKPIVPEILQSKVQVFIDLFRLRQELETSTAKLEQSNQSLEQFAYVASHDLQEPLRAISGFTQLLASKHKTDFDETSVGYIENVVGGVTRMQTLINDLLMYSRVAHDFADFEQVDLGVCVQKAIQNLREAIESSNAEVTVDSLPSIQGQEQQLTQLFQNLIGNALKYHGADKPVITIKADSEFDFWKITFQDNGIGIKDEYQEQIFVIFKRLHRREEYPGTGIGLAICKNVVERHGGTISVESRETIGSSFIVRLPK